MLLALGRSGMARPLAYHVTAEDGGWCLWLAGSTEAPQHFARKADAVRAGIRCAQSAPPSQLLVHAVDGTLERTRTFGLRTGRAAGDLRAEYALPRGAVPPDEI